MLAGVPCVNADCPAHETHENVAGFASVEVEGHGRRDIDVDLGRRFRRGSPRPFKEVCGKIESLGICHARHCRSRTEWTQIRYSNDRHDQ